MRNALAPLRPALALAGLLLASAAVAVAPSPTDQAADALASVCARAGYVSIDGTPKTPTISFDPVTGDLVIRGRSIPENSIEAYARLGDALAAYARHPAPTTHVSVELEVIDKGATELLVGVFKKLEAIHKGGSAVTVMWHYEEDDEDMLEAGKDFRAILNVPFKMVQVAE